MYTHPLVRCKERVEDPPLPLAPTLGELREMMLKLEEVVVDRKGGDFHGPSNVELKERLDILQERIKRVEESIEEIGGLLRQIVGAQNEPANN